MCKELQQKMWQRIYFKFTVKVNKVTTTKYLSLTLEVAVNEQKVFQLELNWTLFAISLSTDSTITQQSSYSTAD